jgi:outer membrane receptor protein involved in Fe transport
VTYTYSHAGSTGHLWKAGATINRVKLDAAMADGFGGMYLFADLADFATGRPNMFRQTFGAISTAYAVQNFGAFIQDHWSVARGLTLDIGLRYDFEHLPSMLRQDDDNLSPRVGLAYQVAPGWVLRSGYGLFFDRYVLASLNPVLQKNGLSAVEQVVEGDAAAAVFQSAGGGPPAAPLVGAMPSI